MRAIQQDTSVVTPVLRIRIVTNLEEKVAIAARLIADVARLKDRFFVECVPRFVEDPSYEFLVAYSEPSTQLRAFGLLGRYTTPKDGGEILAVEAFWFESDELCDQLPVWEFIASRANQLGCKAVCVTDQSTNNLQVEMELLALGLLGDYPVGPEVLVVQKAHNSAPVYSALRRERVEGQAFEVTCMMIRLLDLSTDLSGTILSTDEPLYRGEGRLEFSPYWNCGDLNCVGDWVSQNGFPVVSNTRFAGTLPEQILHQGYVRRSTVSLTRSFKVAASYATHWGKRQQGIVFTVDTLRLRDAGEIFDAYGTLTRCCPWMLPVHFETLRHIVTIVGVREAGLFLKMCSDQARVEVEFGERFFDPPSWSNHLPTSEAIAKVARAGVPTEFLGELHRALEGYWAYALRERDDLLGTFRSEALNRVAKAGLGALAYFEAFDRAYPALDYALRRGIARSPGWDLTALGYVAKTCRDREFFSTGPIPRECIIEANLVSAD